MGTGSQASGWGETYPGVVTSACRRCEFGSTVGPAAWRSNAEMPERQEAVVGVFAVEMVFVPMAVKTSRVGPEGVHEIEARFADRIQRSLQRRQRVKGGRGAQQIGDGCPGNRAKSAHGMALIEQPRTRGGWRGGMAELAQHADGRGGGVGRADGDAALVRPGTVRCFQRRQRVEHPLRFCQGDSQILQRADREERGVSGSGGRARVDVKTAIAGSIGGKLAGDLGARGGLERRNTPGSERSPGPAETASMHEIESFARSERSEIISQRFGRTGFAQGQQRVEGENSVVEVRIPVAILEAA